GLVCLVHQQMQFREIAAAVTTARINLARTKAVYGDDHPQMIGAVRTLAAALSMHGDNGEARSMWDRVIANTEKLYGADRYATMMALRDRSMSEATPNGAALPESKAAIRRAVAIADRILPENDPKRASMYETLSWVVRSDPPNPEELASLERSVALYEK